MPRFLVHKGDSGVPLWFGTEQPSRWSSVYAHLLCAVPKVVATLIRLFALPTIGKALCMHLNGTVRLCCQPLTLPAAGFHQRTRLARLDFTRTLPAARSSTTKYRRQGSSVHVPPNTPRLAFLRFLGRFLHCYCCEPVTFHSPVSPTSLKIHLESARYDFQ